MYSAKYWIDKLKLIPHPEGGFYKELYRNQLLVSPSGYSKRKNTATSIYYLLEHGDKSHFHRLKSDEIWYYHAGDSLNVCMFDKNGKYIEEKLGSDFEKKEKLQVIIPAGAIFGAYLSKPDSYILMGCMVNPGFEFEDFELMDREYLMKQFPQQEEILHLLT